MKKLIVAALFLMPVLMSCKKEGCVFSNAENYDPEAKKDDHSCTYKANLSFWYNQNTSNVMITYWGVTELNVYLDDIKVGTMDPLDWSTGPDCGGSNFTVALDLGTESSRNYNYVIRDQNGTVRYDNMHGVIAKDCSNIELTP